MGDSAKLPVSGPGSYTFVEHRRYLDELLETLGIREKVTFVVHDWGSALGFDWARRHPAAVKGIAYLEAIVKPYTWAEYADPARQLFQKLRSPEGEEMVLNQNSFIEFNLPAGIMRKLSGEEMAEYRRPFAEPGEGRRPTLTWSRQLPVEGDPADVTGIVEAYGDFLAHSEIAKLYIKGEPGRLQPSQHEFCRTWPNQAVVEVKGLHNLQEDSPDEIGQAIAGWFEGLG
jgi:haloalkane dehalogenase